VGYFFASFFAHNHKHIVQRLFLWLVYVDI